MNQISGFEVISFFLSVHTYRHRHSQPTDCTTHTLKVVSKLCFQPVNQLSVDVCAICTRQIYSDWANHYLVKAGHNDRLVSDLQTDLCDGVLLADIIQSVSK